MAHEALPMYLRSVVLSRFASIITAACHERPVNVISVALKTGAPLHMIDAQLPNLWRY